MKKLLSFLMLLTLSVAVYAQQDVTKFLGIPVDGTKTAMIQKLKAKGFKYVKAYDLLEGRFNGSEVCLGIATNGDNIWRILVLERVPTDETNVKIRFNNLYNQFLNNKKYVSAKDSDQSIPDNEDISYEMLIHKKRFDAYFYQVTQESKPNEDYTKKQVWFSIAEVSGMPGRYYITIFYDNLYNKANGEDL